MTLGKELEAVQWLLNSIWETWQRHESTMPVHSRNPRPNHSISGIVKTGYRHGMNGMELNHETHTFNESCRHFAISGRTENFLMSDFWSVMLCLWMPGFVPGVGRAIRQNISNRYLNKLCYKMIDISIYYVVYVMFAVVWHWQELAFVSIVYPLTFIQSNDCASVEGVTLKCIGK